jgi:glutamate racemase
MNSGSIGIIDSGVGGLSIWREITNSLPGESTLYFADSMNCPYGNKSPEEIHVLSKRLVAFLLTQNVKLVVIACNTITVTCLDKLRENYPQVPIVGTVPVIKVAAALSKTKRIGILSTVRTAESDYQKNLIQEFAKDCVVVNEGTNDLVPFVERGELQSSALMKVVKEALVPFNKEEIDVLALGCSHFPFLKEQIQDIIGEQVLILDSGEAIARQTARILTANKSVVVEVTGKHKFYTTGETDQFHSVAKNLFAGTMTEEITVERILV